MITQSVLAVCIILACAAISALLAVSTGAFMRYPVFNRLVKRYLGLPMLATIIGAMYFTAVELVAINRGDNKYLFTFGVVIGILALVFEYAMFVGVFLSRFGLTLHEDRIEIEYRSIAHRLIAWATKTDDWSFRQYKRDLCSVSWNITWASGVFLAVMAWQLSVYTVIFPAASLIGFLCCGRVLDPSTLNDQVKYWVWTESLMFSPILCVGFGFLVGFLSIWILDIWGYLTSFYYLQLYAFIGAVAFCILMTWNLHRKLGRKLTTTKINIPVVDKGFRRAGDALVFVGAGIASTSVTLWQAFKSNACPEFVLADKPKPDEPTLTES